MKQFHHAVGGSSIAKRECLLAYLYSSKESGLHILTFENKTSDVHLKNQTLFFCYEALDLSESLFWHFKDYVKLNAEAAFSFKALVVKYSKLR